MLYIQRQTEANRYREKKMFHSSVRNRFYASGICTDCSRNIIVFTYGTVNIGIECSEFEMKDNKKKHCWVVEKFIINTDIRTVHYDLESQSISHSNMLTCFPFGFRFFFLMRKKNSGIIFIQFMVRIAITGMEPHRVAAVVYFEFFVFKRRLNAGYFNFGFSYSVCLFRHPFHCNFIMIYLCFRIAVAEIPIWMGVQRACGKNNSEKKNPFFVHSKIK